MDKWILFINGNANCLSLDLRQYVFLMYVPEQYSTLKAKRLKDWA